MSSPVIWMVPPFGPLSLPVAVIVPEILMVCFGRPAVCVAPPSTIRPSRVPTELASITPLLLMTEIDDVARGRRGDLDAAAIGAELAVV